MNNNNFNGVDSLNNNPNSMPNQTPTAHINDNPNSSMQSQTSNGVMSTNNSINGQFNDQANSSSLTNSDVSDVSNLVQSTVNNMPQQPRVNQINNNLTAQSNNTSVTSSIQQRNSFQANNVGTTSQNNFQSSNVNSIPQQATTYTTQGPANNTSVNDEILLKSFIGNNYKKITTNVFNFSGFFFTTLYMFYRKMFLYGILLFVVNLVLLNIIDNFIVMLLFNLAVGFSVNKIYLHHVNKKIEKIKFQNQGKTVDELKKICLIKGWTSVGNVFLGFIVEVVIAFIVIIIMFVFGITSAFINFFTGNSGLENGGIQISGTENNESNGTNSTYNGMMMYDTSINIKNEFSISVPNNFDEESDEYEYEYEYESGQGVFDACSVSLSVPIGYSSADNLLNQMATYYADDNPTSVTSTTINNIKWHWFSYDGAFGKTYYYGTTKNNRVYLLEYEVQKDTDSMCESYKEQIINSIQSK